MLDLWFGLDASGFDKACELSLLWYRTFKLIIISRQLNSTSFLDPSSWSPMRVWVTHCCWLVRLCSPVICIQCLITFDNSPCFCKSRRVMTLSGWNTNIFYLDSLEYFRENQRWRCSGGKIFKQDQIQLIHSIFLHRQCSEEPCQRLRGKCLLKTSSCLVSNISQLVSRPIRCFRTSLQSTYWLFASSSLLAISYPRGGSTRWAL
jgi:hypothetical protein